MTAKEFFSNTLGASIQYNKSTSSKYQCVDYCKAFCDRVLNIYDKHPEYQKSWSFGNAKDWYANAPTDFFTKIKNTPSFVPAEGDIVVFSTGTYGHVAVCTGYGNTKRFLVVEQNIEGKYVSARSVAYKNIVGFLRKK